jgi:hypothetical protein
MEREIIRCDYPIIAFALGFIFRTCVCASGCVYVYMAPIRRLGRCVYFLMCVCVCVCVAAVGDPAVFLLE